MEKISKKEIRSTLAEKMSAIVTSFEIAQPSKKTEKVLNKMSKKLAGELKVELKKHLKKMAKASSLKGQEGIAKTA